MGLTLNTRSVKRMRTRLHTSYWRARHWWMDTEGGARARVLAWIAGLVVCVADVAAMLLHAAAPAPAGTPHEAVVWWVVYLIVALVAAAVSYALRPKLDQQQPAEEKGPTTEDGQAGIYYRGTHIVRDTFLLGWKMVGRDPIKGSSGK